MRRGAWLQVKEMFAAKTFVMFTFQRLRDVSDPLRRCLPTSEVTRPSSSLAVAGAVLMHVAGATWVELIVSRCGLCMCRLRVSATLEATLTTLNGHGTPLTLPC